MKHSPLFEAVTRRYRSKQGHGELGEPMTSFPAIEDDPEDRNGDLAPNPEEGGGDDVNDVMNDPTLSPEEKALLIRQMSMEDGQDNLDDEDEDMT